MKEVNQEIVWSKDAINCWELQADCTRCLLAKILETPCKMDLTVRKIIAAIGEPSEENTQKERKPHRFYRKRISSLEIINTLKRTTKKEAAKQFGMSLCEMSKLMKNYNINGNLIRGERQRNKK